MRLTSFCVSVALALTSCGGPSTETATGARVDRDHRRAATDGELRFGAVAFPELPATVELAPEARQSCEQFFTTEAPVLSIDGQAIAYDAFVSGRYQPWLAAQGGHIRHFHRAMGGPIATPDGGVADASAGENATPQEAGSEDSATVTVRSAMEAAMLAQLARQVGAMPLPPTARENESQRVVYRNAFISAAYNLYQRARDAFGECASTGQRSGNPDLDRWVRFCDEGLDRVVDVPRPLD